jgi:hypothetical protein
LYQCKKASTNVNHFWELPRTIPHLSSLKSSSISSGVYDGQIPILPLFIFYVCVKVCDWLPDERKQTVLGWPPVAHKICMRLAASRIQIGPEWPPVACKLPRFASSRGQISVNFIHVACDWQATRVQFAYNWRPLGYNLNATGRQSHAILSSGANVIIWEKCYHLGRNVIIWDEMLSCGAYVIIWDEMLSSGMKCNHLELMLSSGMKCYHLELMLLSGTKCYHRR